MEAVLVHVIIVTYNAMSWIEKCLSSFKDDQILTEIIVVDNCSQDGTQEYIRRNYPKIKLIENQSNLGFGKANNIGIRDAYLQGAQQLLLLNQDAWLEKDTLVSLSKVMKSDPSYYILSPIHVEASRPRLDGNFLKYISEAVDGKMLSDYILKEEQDEVYEVPFVNAAVWLVSRECIEQIGLFDELFHHYGEDNNYAQRVLFHGGKIGVLSNVFAYHDRDTYQDRKRDPFLEELKTLLIHSADINHDGISYFKTHVRKKRIRSYLSLFQFSFSEYYRLRTQLRKIKKLLPMIRESRERNLLKGQKIQQS